MWADVPGLMYSWSELWSQRSCMCSCRCNRYRRIMEKRCTETENMAMKLSTHTYYSFCKHQPHFVTVIHFWQLMVQKLWLVRSRCRKLVWFIDLQNGRNQITSCHVEWQIIWFEWGIFGYLAFTLRRGKLTGYCTSAHVLQWMTFIKQIKYF